MARDVYILGTGSTWFLPFNTNTTDGGLGALTGAVLRVSINGNGWVDPTTDGVYINSTHTYSTGSTGVTGLNRLGFIVDSTALSLAANDTLDVFLSTGTVASQSQLGRYLWGVQVVSANLSTAVKADIGDAVWDEIVDGSTITGRHSMRIQNSAAAGLSSGAGTATFTVRDLDDTQNRIVATVSSGNRTAVTLDVSS